MNSFERFQKRNIKRMEAVNDIGTNFIFKGYPSTQITHEEVETDEHGDTFISTTTVNATVINEQEKDKAYIYTPLDDKLTIGSIWGAKTLHWLIAEEIVVIKHVHWNKYLAYLCNIEVENTWGYFKGPEKNYVNIKNEYGASLESLQKPVLVLPAGILGFEDKIVINQRPWLVQEWDAISSPGLVYYSLRATTISKEVAEAHKDELVYIERATKEITPVIVDPTEDPEEPQENVYYIGHEIDINLVTEEGFFKYDNKQIKIKERTATTVTFILPFGVDKVTVQTKEGGEVITETFVAQ